IHATRIDSLTIQLDARHRDCYLVDYGDGGLIAAHLATVYSELGLSLGDRPTGDGRAATTPISAESVKDALRNVDRPMELARSPLARGRSSRERAESVRALMVDASDGAFGREPEEQLLAEILRRRYLGEP